MTVRNLTTGESQGVNINNGSDIPKNDQKIIIFNNVETTMTLNNAFKKYNNITINGGNFSLKSGVAGAIKISLIRIISASNIGAQKLSSL